MLKFVSLQRQGGTCVCRDRLLKRNSIFFSWASSCSFLLSQARFASSAEQPATSSRSNVTMDEAAAHTKMLRLASSAAQPASDNIGNSAVRPVVAVRNIINTATHHSSRDSMVQISNVPRESLLLIVRDVGAHNLETIWTCSECKPYWFNWYCDECQKTNKFLYWSQRRHFGHCGQSCGCCRSASGADGGCDACDELWNLKVTCPRMRDLLKTYDGT